MGCIVFIDGVSQKPDRRHHHWRLQQWSLHHPLGEHRNPFSLLLNVFEVVKHFRYFIADGRRASRAEDFHWILGRLFGIEQFLTDSVVHRREAAGRVGARIQGRHFGVCGKIFRERK